MLPIEPDAVRAGTALSQNLIRTIRLRREMRTAPQILIVEDDGFVQRLLGTLFAPHFKLTMARTGADAVDLYLQCAPDVVLLNIGLPDRSGFEVLTRIRALDPYAHIIMLSGQASRENVLRATELGAKGFIGKPFTSEKLMSCVSKSPFVQEKRMHALARSGMIVSVRAATGLGEDRRSP